MLELFFSFFKIGLFTFGGGYAMIPLVTELATVKYGLSEEIVLNFIAICESTPGPIAINMATFLGYNQYGVLGAVLATLGVVLPSFIIILLIAIFSSKVLKLFGVQCALKGIRPVVIGLIIATGLNIFLKIVFSIKDINSTFLFDYKSLIIFGVCLVVYYSIKAFRKKVISPIILIIISAVLGILLFGVL